MSAPRDRHEGQHPARPRRPRGLYAARHNPFVYLHSIIDSTACQTNVIGLDQLQTDLSSVRPTPNYSFIVPDLCNDGHDEPCINGQPGGLVQANSFSRRSSR